MDPHQVRHNILEKMCHEVKHVVNKFCTGLEQQVSFGNIGGKLFKTKYFNKAAPQILLKIKGWVSCHIAQQWKMCHHSVVWVTTNPCVVSHIIKVF